MTRKRNLWRTLARLTRSVRAYLSHPQRVTCLDCGFLALADKEVGSADRVLLGVEGTSGCPPLEALRCSRSLWINYDLMYGATDAAGIFEELKDDRRKCVGFYRYKPGWSPAEHQDLLLKAAQTKERIVFALLGSALTLLIAWVTKLFDLR